MKSNKMKSRFSLALTLALLSPLVANAGPIALDIVQDGTTSVPVADDVTIGWAFSINAALTLDALATWDQDADGLNESQTVSLWTEAGILLSSVLVDNTATPIAPGFASNTSGQWLFQDVADIVLGIGNYVIGTDRNGGSGDVFQLEDTILSLDPRVVFQGDRYSSFGAFAFPTITTVGTAYEGNHFFGPTFSIAGDVVAAPEPGSLALFGLGLAAIGFTRRRKNA
jgi:hypothetical protein